MKRHANSPRIVFSREAPETYPDPRSLRDSLGMSAREFAETYGFAVGTVRDWDVYRYEPDRMARAYLRRIALYPDLLREDSIARKQKRKALA